LKPDLKLQNPEKSTNTNQNLAEKERDVSKAGLRQSQRMFMLVDTKTTINHIPSK
jgi:hypothetical protein